MTFDVCAWWTHRTGQTMHSTKSEFAQWLRELEETIRKQHAGCSEADQRDAARYRWLREHPDAIDWGHSLVIPNDAETWEFGKDTGKLLDAAIDAALRQSAPDQR